MFEQQMTFIEWYVWREKTNYEKDPKQKEVMLKLLKENPEVIEKAIQEHRLEDQMTAIASGKVAAIIIYDVPNFPKKVIAALKKEFL